MAIDDQLSSLLDRTGTILARQNDWADGQVMLLAGSKDDPDSYNAVGGKVGDLGYYPVRNVNGQTVYMPCIERQKVIADGNVAVVTAPAIKRTRGQLTLNEVGGRTDNDDNSELAAEWLDDCAKNQSEAILAKDSDLDGAPGTYFAKPILVNPKKPLKITGRPGTTIQGVTDVWANETDPVDSRAVIVITCDENSKTPVLLRGFTINNSGRRYSHANPSGTALTVRNASTFIYENMVFDAGQHFAKNLISKRGDSGISATNCDTVIGMYSTHIGQPDKGEYISLATNVRLYAMQYIGCNTTAGLTRAGTSIDITGSMAIDCGQGHTVYWWDGAGYFQQAGVLTARGLRFKRCGSRLLYALGGGTIVADGVFIEDFGWTLNDQGVLVPSSSRTAVRLEGASNSQINLDISMKDWADSEDLRAVEFRDFTEGGQSFYCRGNRLNGRIANMPNGRGVGEYGGSTGNVTDFIYDNVSTNRQIGDRSPVYTARPNSSIHTIRDRDGTFLYRQKSGVPLDGSWTPRLSAAGATGVTFTHTRQIGSYEQIGKQIFMHYEVQATVAIEAGAVHGDIRIGGMTMMDALGGGDGHGDALDLGGITYPTGGYSLTGETPSGQYYIRFYWNGPVRRYATSADLTNGGNVRIKGTIVFQAEYDATWTPERLGAAVVGWFDAASTISLTLVDNKVAAWKNRGVAALSIGQVTAAKRPAYNSAGWDATRPCLSSGGGNDGPILTGPISTLSGNRWLFIVAERAVQDATNTSTALRALVSTGDAAGNRVYPSVLLPSSDAAQTGFRVQASGTGGGAAQVAPWAIDTKAVLFSSIGATMGAGINGATPSGTAALGSGSPVTEFGIFGLVGSATTDKASRLAGKISEVLVIDPTLLPNGGSTFDRQKIEGYLAHKWGIQNSLAAGHPFLTTAPVN